MFGYDYDDRGRLVRKKIPGAGVASQGYDLRDRITSSTDAKGTTVVTSYDDLDRVSSTSMASGQLLTQYFYDRYSYAGSKPFDLMSGSTVSYTYTATGQKLRAIFPGNKQYDYVAGLVYAGATNSTTLEFIATTEGRILPPGRAENPSSTPGGITNRYYRYEYHLKDHLGNLRVACRCPEISTAVTGSQLPGPGDTYPLMVMQEEQYDPWGLSLTGLSSLTVANASRFKYINREEQQGLGWIDLMARQYDPQTGRFMGVDPLAEVVSKFSPYAYVYNNPISFIDPDGMLGEDPYAPKKQKDGSYLLREVTIKGKKQAPTQYLSFIQFPNNNDYTVSHNKMKGYSIIKQYNLFDEWVTGVGPQNRVFLADHPMTKDLQKSYGVQRARAYFYKKYIKAWLANGIANSVNRGGLTNFSASFNPVMGPIRAGTSLTEQFVGNFRVDISTINGGDNLMFRVSDSKSRNSFYYHIQDLLGSYTPSFLQDRERVPEQIVPEGNTYQIYMWTERNTFYLDPQPPSDIKK